MLQARELKFIDIKRFAQDHLSRQASSQMPSIGMYPLFYDGNMMYQSMRWDVECLLLFIMFNIPYNLEGSGALGYDWLELTLLGPPVVCISRAFHVTHTLYFYGF